MIENVEHIIAIGTLVLAVLFGGGTVALLVYYLVKKIDRESEENFEKRDN